MRNLKKTLCLVLALVFVLGLCTVGAANGTDFSDKAEIKYDTAVKAMSGLGILKGDDNDGDGKFDFRPTDDVTRAEAAKIIAYLVVGEEAEKWPARQVFDDVPADHWAARYVAYCQHNGIIAGYGNGKFGPNDKVTQAQFAKMLLASCGYGAKGEYEGASWDQNVAKDAMKTKVLKGLLNADWDAPANREETAQLAYNCLMNVVQVVVSKDTDSYVALEVNGEKEVTLGESTWNLKINEGIIVANKATDSTKKGTELTGKVGDTVKLNGTTKRPDYFITDEDENADLLGHWVKITFRVEVVNGEEAAVAYYIEDNCKEYGAGSAVLGADTFTGYVTFNNGVVDTSTAVLPAKNSTARNNDMNKWVVNEDGKIVSWKRSGYFLTALTVTNGKATFTDAFSGSRITVTAPEGAKTGDIYTITPYDKEYVLEACTKVEGVKITQKQFLMNIFWGYNDGKYSCTFGNTTQLNLPASINKCAGDFNSANSTLTLGATYTLYLDAKGGFYGYVEEESGNTTVSNFVYVVKHWAGTDDFGDGAKFAQVVKSDGTIVQKLRYFGTDPTDGQVYKYSSTMTLDSAAISNAVVGAKLLIVNGEAYTKNPKVDIGSATKIYVSGSGALLKTSTTDTPAVDTSTVPGGTASTISYVYVDSKEGSTPVLKVQALWFTEASESYASTSYIYMINKDVKYTRVINGVNVEFRNGYKDGVEMNDMTLQLDALGNPTGDWATGEFFKYTTDGNGAYKLQKVQDTDASKTGARTIYMCANDADAEAYILRGKLYIGTSTSPIDLTDVKVVRFATKRGVNADADYAAYNDDPTKATLTIDSVAALESAIAMGYGVTIKFVENIVGLTHSVGGSVIYVTAVK